MGDVVSKPVRMMVIIDPKDSEYLQLQAIERAAVNIGGEVGHAVLDAVDKLRDGVIERAMR